MSVIQKDTMYCLWAIADHSLAQSPPNILPALKSLLAAASLEGLEASLMVKSYLRVARLLMRYAPSEEQMARDYLQKAVFFPLFLLFYLPASFFCFLSFVPESFSKQCFLTLFYLSLETLSLISQARLSSLLSILPEGLNVTCFILLDRC